MKKLKIFLLLSILLCFGFALSSEVHAQGAGPKIFEVGDVLPATTQLRITSNNIDIAHVVGTGQIKTDNDNFLFCDFAVGLYDDDFFIDGIDYRNEMIYQKFVIIDTSSWSLSKRTVSTVSGIFTDEESLLLWEDLNAPPAPSGPKLFEEEDVLPAGYIKISWDFTGKFNDIFDYDVTFWIAGDGDSENNLYIEIEVWDYGEEVRFTINDEEFHIDTPGETVISIPIPYTIVQVDANNEYDYYDSIGDALLWEVVTEEEFIYDQGYQDGYSDGYFWGYGHARGLYGYYDSNTDEWLSVAEYLNRYGTDKPGQSDFYANFDKYFIPAMIIVFGGAIVLTILKVFKGRE